MSGAIVTARVSEDVKKKAEAVIEGRGLTASQVIRSLYDYIGTTGSIPECLSLDEEYEAMLRKQRRRAFVEHYRDRRPPVTLSDDEVRKVLLEKAASL